MSLATDRISPLTAPAANSTSVKFSVFAWLWASQALVHQEFYSGWLEQRDPRGWILTVFAVATLLRPSSVPVFCGMLVASVVYNVAKWPFVVNHILLESLINVMLLAAVIRTALVRRSRADYRVPFGDDVIDCAAPVIGASVMVMYWFAFVAKLNTDFLNPTVSCVTAMYGDLQRRLPFLPGTTAAHQTCIGLTLLVELLIPLLLSFRCTRPFAILIGLPFHLLLGLVGHRTFSGLAFALYGLLIIDLIVPIVEQARQRLVSRTTAGSRRAAHLALAIVVAGGVALLIAAKHTGHFSTRIGGVGIYQIPWLIWIAWSLLVGAVCYLAIWRSLRTNEMAVAIQRRLSPGPIWIAVSIVFLNGLTPYLGLKTETSFTMYSNLRIEGEWNNHLFMPAIKLGPWQTDLVQVLATDHPALLPYIEEGDLITYFELRRIVDQTSSELPFQIIYTRRNEQHLWSQTADGTRSHTATDDSHPQLLGRLLYFRPISTDECMPCRH